VGVYILISTRNKRRLKRLALLYRGIKEQGFNAGWQDKTFEEMMKNVGWKGGEAWCMYFATMIYVNALPKYAMDIKKVLGGSTQGSFNRVEKGESDLFEAVKSGKPKVGDIAIWQRVSDAGKGHAGVVVKVYDGGKKFDCIEGNTSDDPTFKGEGDLVGRVTHNLAYGEKSNTYPSLKFRGFIRLK
jgi:hypothetical protein